MEISDTYDKVLELEGLVLLLQMQDANAPKKDAVIRQIRYKLDEISAQITNYSDGITGEECPGQNPAVEFAGEDLEQAVKDAEADIVAVEESIHEEIEDIATAEALNAVAGEEAVSEIIIEGNGIDVNKSAFAHKTSGDIRKAFTLNDNYKFRRQLFHNSRQEYAQALSEIERMNSLAEAEDYVYRILHLDRDNADVKDFMDIISAYLSGK